MLKHLFKISMLLLVSACFSDSAHAKAILETDLLLSSPIVDQKQKTVGLSFVVTNLSDSPIDDLQLSSGIKLNNHKDYQNVLKFYLQSDPNSNQILDAGETWIYEAHQSFEYVEGGIYQIYSAIRGQIEGVEIIATDVEQLYNIGVNMDMDIPDDAFLNAGDTIEVKLVSRLLVDEDGAMNPGFTTFKVGEQTMKVQLAASRWEARDLMISATTLNDGQPFSPFDPPKGIELINFCDQENRDQGRNLMNVLDEADPIETVRAPCTEFGENDINCEFPDWVFCYKIILPEDYEPSTFKITATDHFSMWQSKEIDPGSGNFGEFADVSNKVDISGEDFAIKSVHTIEFSDLILDVDTKNDACFISSLGKTGAVNVVIYSKDGRKIIDQQFDIGKVDHLINLDKGDYQIIVFNLDGDTLGDKRFSLLQ